MPNNIECISWQWNRLEQFLTNCPSYITIFGYSAPKSDIEAKKLLYSAHSNSAFYDFVQFEFINTENEDKLLKNWNKFIFNHHCECYDNFFNSSLGQYPRRTCEKFKKQELDAQFLTPHPYKQHTSLKKLWKSMQKLM